MSELNLGPPPSRSPLPAVLIAGCVLPAVFAVVFFFTPHNTAELAVTGVKVYTAVTQSAGSKGGLNVIGATPSIDQDLYILVTVKLTDKLRLPLFIKDETAVLTAQDGSVLETSALQKGNLEQVYAVFPRVAALASPPLTRGTQIDPGKSAEGMVLLHFPGANDDNWKSRKSATLSLVLYHQEPQTVVIP